MRSPSIKQAAVVALAAVAATNSAPAKAEPIDPAHPQSMDLHTAVQQEKLTGDFRGNGRDKMRAILTNKTGANLTVRVPAGQMFEAGSNVVIVVRAGEVEVNPARRWK